MASKVPADNRLAELLADRATQGLNAGEAEELDRLLRQEPEVDPTSFDLAAAAIHLTGPFDDEPLPAGLEAKLQARAAELATEVARAPAPGRSAEISPAEAPSRGWYQRLGWYAAAACLAAAVAGWWPGRVPPPPRPLPVPAPPVVAPPPAPLSFADVAAASDALLLDWSGTEDPAAAGAGGEVVWSNELQQGFMRFAGLLENEPGEFQYQLWIFDKNQDERYPIDGGVFDIDAGEVVVPIDAKLAVTEPTLFAITVEKPGGVVVSSRERIVLVAAAG